MREIASNLKPEDLAPEDTLRKRVGYTIDDRRHR